MNSRSCSTILLADAAAGSTSSRGTYANAPVRWACSRPIRVRSSALRVGSAGLAPAGADLSVRVRARAAESSPLATAAALPHRHGLSLLLVGEQGERPSSYHR